MSSLPGGGSAPAPRHPAAPTDGEGEGEEPMTEPEEVPPPPEEGVPGIPGSADEDPLTGELAEEVEVPDTDASPSEARDDANLTAASLSRTFADLDDDAQLAEVLEKLEWGLPPRSFDARLGVTVRGPERWDEVLAWMASEAECARYDWTRTYGGWNAFQLAAREGCGDALANMHVNCIDKTTPGASPTPPRGNGNPNAAPWEFVVDSVAPDGCNMLHLIAIGWANLDHGTLPEITKFARRVIDRMTPEQVTAVQEKVGTPLHAAAAAGATFGNFFRYLLQKGPEAMEVRHDDKTPKELAKEIYESLTKELRASKQAARVSRVGLRPLRETNVYGSDVEERLGWYDSPETEALLRHIDGVKERQQHTQLCFEDMVEHRRKSARMERIARLEAEKPPEPEPGESPQEIAAREEKEKKEKLRAARKRAVERLSAAGIDAKSGKTHVLTLDEVLKKMHDGLPPPSKTSDEISRGPDAIDVVLANMASKTQCRKHRWDTTHEGWNVFQLAAREGLGDALDNLHSNCVDRSSVFGYGKKVSPAETAVSWEFLVESVAPDGRNMIHLIAAGWNHLRDRDLTEATSFAKALALRMTVAQLRMTGGDGGGTCLHGLAAAGANTRNLLKYVLDRGGREMLEMTNARGETPLQCARAALEALKAEDKAADARLAKILPPHVTEDPAEVEDIKRRLMAKFHRKKQGLASCIEELELAAKASGAVSSPPAARGRSERPKQPAAQKPEPEGDEAGEEDVEGEEPDFGGAEE